MTYTIVNGDAGIASLSLSGLSKGQRAEIEERFGQDLLTPELIVFYDENRDWVVMNRDHANYQLYLELSQAYLSSEKDVRSQLFEMIPDRVKHFIAVLEMILQRREARANEG